jgi:CheY-like chemotaxis protein
MPDTPQQRTLDWSHVYDFQHLMARRVENIILASSTYDTFILQEDGLLSELLLGEFLELNLHHTTGLTHVSSGAEAIALASSDSRFNLIISAISLTDMNAAELAQRVKDADLDIPVVLLAFDGGALAEFTARYRTSGLERIFLWQGDPRILLAITKYMEDKLNAAYDVGVAGVQVVLLVEDNIRYYSSFLPVIYTEIIEHSQRLISEGGSTAHRVLAMRARPKILLRANYEEAWECFSAYQENVLGVISDIEFPRAGVLDPEAGTEFTHQVKAAWPDIPVLLQSSRPGDERLSREAGAEFLLKGSSTLLDDLRAFMVDNLAFGDFVFRLPDGTRLGQAKDMESMLNMLGTVPSESVTYHAERNDFSRWLKARTEFHLAHHLRARTAADYDSPESRRRYLVQQLNDYRRELARESVSDFDPATFDPDNSFSRIGNGSLGGKARALAFVRHLLRDFSVTEQFPGMQITVPPSLVLTTEVFDRFLEENDLRAFALESENDEEVDRRFLAAALPEEVERRLAAYSELVRYPLAVRSSSLLEDSQYQPLAGAYETYLIPNNHSDGAERLHYLMRAVKRVYASTYRTHAKNCFKVTPYLLEEEKMAVIIQRVVGAPHDTRFYPDISGVGRSHNFYPSPPLTAADGVVTVALGLGRIVVDGGISLSFSPRHPQHLMHFSTVRDMLSQSQREFLALDLDGRSDDATERYHPLTTAEMDGTLDQLASTYSPENDAVYDGTARQGVRLVTFAPILKQRSFPLSAALDRLLALARWGMNTEVEIEFALRLSHSPETPADFGFIQARPMVLSRELEDFDINSIDPTQSLVRSSSVLGDGRLAHIHDVLAVDHVRFDRAKSREVAQEVARFNAAMVKEGTPYILIGLGRWGSADPWLGIPVTWEQISGARVIVESGLKDIKVTPSQGSHFFQNITSFRVGYFTVNPEGGEGILDWEWLAAQPSVEEDGFVRRLHFAEPLVVAISGKHQAGVILKPGVAGLSEPAAR